jgi:hypothetical protein
MTTNDYQMHQDLIHELVLQIDELTKDNAALSKYLNAADAEIANLKARILSLQGSQPGFFSQPLASIASIFKPQKAEQCRRASDRRKNCESRRADQRNALYMDRRMGDRRSLFAAMPA